MRQEMEWFYVFAVCLCRSDLLCHGFMCLQPGRNFIRKPHFVGQLGVNCHILLFKTTSLTNIVPHFAGKVWPKVLKQSETLHFCQQERWTMDWWWLSWEQRHQLLVNKPTQNVWLYVINTKQRNCGCFLPPQSLSRGIVKNVPRPTYYSSRT